MILDWHVVALFPVGGPAGADWKPRFHHHLNLFIFTRGARSCQIADHVCKIHIADVPRVTRLEAFLTHMLMSIIDVVVIEFALDSRSQILRHKCLMHIDVAVMRYFDVPDNFLKSNLSLNRLDKH